LFFLIAAVIVASIKLIKIWHIAPPFRLLRQANDPTFRRLLERSADSLKHWTWCTIVVLGIVLANGLQAACGALLNEAAPARASILFAIEDLSSALNMALLVVLFLFLIRWHVLTRIKHLSDSQLGH
jgi:hypothetical protein